MKNQRMKELRGDRTQKEAANDLGIPVSTYAMIENGHRFPRMPLLERVVKYFGVSIEELFFDHFNHVS